ncbi:hypothetical protein K488DRAFT_56675, partial [Vararia minispora EC-137]
LLCMPMDILFEIFGHLQPGDLVNLSRINKSFHRVLSSKRSALMWKAALSNARGGGAPSCPVDISELGWANLLFGGSSCQVGSIL